MTLSASRSEKSQSSTTCISVRRPSNSRRIAVDLVGDLGQPLGQLAVVDLEHRLERRQLLAQAAPLVDAAHALHQQALRRQLDHVLATDVLELDLELAVAPHQQAIDRLFAGEPAQLGVDHLAVAKVDRRALARRGCLKWITPDLRLISIVWIRSTTAMSASCPANLVRDSRLFSSSDCALLLLQEDLDAGDDLFDVDRLGEVVLDAELEAADLVLDVGLRGQEDERDLRPVGVLLAAARRARSRPSPASWCRR